MLIISRYRGECSRCCAYPSPLCVGRRRWLDKGLAPRFVDKFMESLEEGYGCPSAHRSLLHVNAPMIQNLAALGAGVHLTRDGRFARRCRAAGWLPSLADGPSDARREQQPARPQVVSCSALYTVDW